MSAVSSTQPEGGAPRLWLALTAAVTAAMLARLITYQPFDTNFYSLWEATNLLAGDHPYRDFFEWGVPLQAALSAVMQWLVGYRIGGEFVLIHWPFIIAGAVISFDLGYRLTRSVTATAFTALLALAVLPDTPTFHYPKLFLYPAAIWLAWRYMDRPGVGPAAALGVLTAAGFLFRHDHGIYIGIAAVLACGLARAADPHRPWRRTLADTGAYTLVATVLLLPWLVLVQTSEGLPGYVRARTNLYDQWSGEHALVAIMQRNPLEFTKGWAPPPPKPGVVTFRWDDSVTPDDQPRMERQYGLRRVGGPDDDRRWRYDIDNVYDPRLNELRNRIESTEGLDWERLEALRSWIPAREPARIWLAQITVVIPLLFVLSAGLTLARCLAYGIPAPPRSLRLLLAGIVLTIVDAKLFREVSYAHLVAPVTGAMGAYFLTVPPRPGVMDWARLSVAGVLAAATTITAIACMTPGAIFARENWRVVPIIVRQMLHYPPIDNQITRAEAERVMTENDHAAWLRGDVGARPEILQRYVHDCTADGDRVLVSGQTPFQIGYLVERPVAGGHVFWHHRWLADPEHETRLLALLQRQSVPFALSTHDPVLDDLTFYPSIKRHFAAHYQALPGSFDRLLVDTRRTPTGTFGPYRFPCFN
jgi:hypothetical protein